MMELLHKYETVLELDKVLKQLGKYAVSEDAAKAALSLKPYSESDRIEMELNKTDSALMLLLRFGNPPLSGLKNPAKDLGIAATGVALSIPSLLNIGAIFRQARIIRNWREHCDADETFLDTEFYRLSEDRAFEKELERTILTEDSLSDNASEELRHIRREIKRQSRKIKDSLEKLIHSTSQKYLQENIITVRDNRYVVPVKSEYRSQIPGLLHDTSSSGATVFIEPSSVVEANNEIRVLMGEERKETERILCELSALVVSCSGTILNNYNTIISLDLYFAKAAYAVELKATKPSLSKKPFLELKEARHPLLDPKTVVPVSIRLGREYDTLLITGPNTGGKTVALKTTGLLVYMAKCGLLLPVAYGSVIYPFDKILADIGDEQSIEQSLSTFSAHISHIIEILSGLTSESLVLLDELGSGTDPLEGAALAKAVLEEIRRCGSLLMATTHYAELKAYALQTDGVENASFEFDVKNLRPTYRLIIGLPGRSNAFAISKQLGLSDRLLREAESYLSQEGRQFEDVISALEEAVKKCENEYLEIEKSGVAVKELKADLEKRENELSEKQARCLEEASERAKYIVDEVQSEANRVINELNEIRKHEKSTDTAKLLGQAKALSSGAVNRMYGKADVVIEKKLAESYTLPRELRKGDKVLVCSMNQKGILLEDVKKSEKVLLQIGHMKMRVSIDDLKLVENQNKSANQKAVSSSIGMISRKGAISSTEIDLRGKTAEESLTELDQFIDHAVLSKLNQITIIHGKGTGTLRKAVQAHLKKHPNIKSCRLGVFGEGDSGVTVAELR